MKMKTSRFAVFYLVISLFIYAWLSPICFAVDAAYADEVIKKAEEINDEGTIDMMGAYIRELEKTSWMLSAWNKKPNETLQSEVAETVKATS